MSTVGSGRCSRTFLVVLFVATAFFVSACFAPTDGAGVGSLELVVGTANTSAAEISAMQSSGSSLRRWLIRC